jgi:hypothetical protein
MAKRKSASTNMKTSRSHKTKKRLATKRARLAALKIKRAGKWGIKGKKGAKRAKK